MKVKFLMSAAGPLVSFQPGQVYDLDDKTAKRLIAAGVAEKVGQREPEEAAPVEKSGDLEAAVAPAPENAARPDPKPRTRRPRK